MIFAVFLCAWIDGSCHPVRRLGNNNDVLLACLEYTARSTFKDGCLTILVKDE